jgi:hypothetical protein
MSKPKIFFALPVYMGVETRALKTLIGCLAVVEGTIQVIGGCPEIGKARSELMAAFLRSNCEYLFFLDSDVGFEPQVLLDMIACELPLVACAYRQKVPPHHWTCAYETGELCKALEDLTITVLRYTKTDGASPHRLRVIPITHAGLGCTLVHRDVPEIIQKTNRNLFYTSDTQDPVCDMFSSFITKDQTGTSRRRSEDTAFFLRTLQNGIQPVCLLDATLDHSGTVANLGETIDAVQKARQEVAHSRRMRSRDSES